MKKKACSHNQIQIRATRHERRSPRIDILLRVTAQCQQCKQYTHFLGLPSSWLPDAPHPAGSEDDGTNAEVCYLPGIFLE
jgi:hypothetical protein